MADIDLSLGFQIGYAFILPCEPGLFLQQLAQTSPANTDDHSTPAAHFNITAYYVTTNDLLMACWAKLKHQSFVWWDWSTLHFLIHRFASFAEWGGSVEGLEHLCYERPPLECLGNFAVFFAYRLASNISISASRSAAISSWGCSNDLKKTRLFTHEFNCSNSSCFYF